MDRRAFGGRFLPRYSPLCRKCPLFFWWFWWFCLPLNLWEYWKWRCLKCPILSSLLLNLWTFITAEPLRFLTYLSVYCWTFELCLLLNLWDSLLPYLFTAEPLNFVYCWTFEILDLFARETNLKKQSSVNCSSKVKRSNCLRLLKKDWL